MDDVAAFILAGGKSSRMGNDKSLMQLAGKPLLERALGLAREVASSVQIVGDPQRFPQHGSVVEDIFHDRGPLGGIHAALHASNAELNLMLAVDLPFVQPGLLRYLLSCARESAALATVPQADGGWQPLCAVYRRRFAAFAENALRAGENRVDSLFAQVETRTVAGDELERLGFSTRMFRNLNTPEEFAQAEKAMKNEVPGKVS